MSLGNVHITPQLVQAVRDAVDIVALASDHTRLRKAGRRYQGLCPIHKEKTPSFSVDPVQGLFYCFGCGSGGDAIKLHMQVTGDDFPAAIEALATRYGIPLPSRMEKAGGRPERNLDGALQAAAEYFTDQLRKSAEARAYLERRQIPAELIERFGLGYAPDGWRNLVGALHPRIPLADLEAAGLAGRSEKRQGEPFDRFRHRLMFPIHSPTGHLVGFGGRTLGDDPAKYINTAETDRFHKGFLLYGLSQGKREIRESGRAILVEGYFDVIGTVASGVEGAVAGMGTALTPEQAKLLSRYAEEVVVAYDGDNAGQNAFRRALPLLLAEGLGVRRAGFPAGHDPDSLRLAEGGAAVAEALNAAEDAVMVELDRLIPRGAAREPREQSKAATAVADLLRPIPDSILRYSYGRVAADRLDLPVEVLARRFGGGEAGPRGDRGPDSQRPGPSGGAARPAGGKVLEWDLEANALEKLFQGDGPIPPPEKLPDPEVFFDAECRNIYRTFRTLYARGDGSPPPDARSVLAQLGSEGRTVDRMAAILLEGSVTPGKVGLLESLEKLHRRWQQKRLRELTSEIAEAQRKKDWPRLESLMEEKEGLSRSLHRGSRPDAGGAYPG
jgi:DNA primase